VSDPIEAAAFQRFVTLAVLLPERFRGGCAFGGNLIDHIDSASLSRRSDPNLFEVTHEVKADVVLAQRVGASAASD
jgi:hypothetical protein